MGKNHSDTNKFQTLGREFIKAAHAHSEGLIFRSWMDIDPDNGGLASSDEGLKMVLTRLFRDSLFQTVFPSQSSQDEIGRLALANSGVAYTDVKQTLKKEGFKDIVTILGRVTHLDRQS